MMEADETFMQEALKEAKKAYAKEEVPVGAVVVFNGQIIARGHNQVEQLCDASAHAEMIALTTAASHLGDWRLKGMTLYTTLEPCAMCAAAALQFRVDRIVWGAKDSRLGANGSWIDLFSFQHPMHSIEVQGGVLEEESSILMQQFFQERRANAKYVSTP